MAEGSFEFADDNRGDSFNLKPKDVATPIPEDQRQLNHEVYEARNVLKLIRERGGFDGEDDL